MAWKFDQPGFNTDFANPNEWHKYMSDIAEDIIKDVTAKILNKEFDDVTDEEIAEMSPELGYVNPIVEEPPTDAKPINVQAWGGFPRGVERRDWSDIASNFDPEDPDGRYRAVEALGQEDYPPGVFVDFNNAHLVLPVRHRQDEYLEWKVSPDGRSVAFVTEGYDYFSQLFKVDEQKVVSIYQDLTKNSAITADDLRATNGIRFSYDDGRIRTVALRGEFNPRNRFNLEGGIVHLSHRANSLGAEIFLAGQSAIARLKHDGSLLDGTDAEELLCCNLGGGPNRNSDPIISKAAYGQLMQGKRYTLSNPVGLYIADVDFDAVRLPNAADTPVPREWWHAERGEGLNTPSDSRVLRLELRIPEGEMIDGRPLLLTDLRVGGGPLRYPGQLANLISVHLFVTSWHRDGGGVGPSIPCSGTCCILPDSPILYATPRSRPCNGSFDDKFPGLINAEPETPVARDMRSDPVAKMPMRRV